MNWDQAAEPWEIEGFLASASPGDSRTTSDVFVTANHLRLSEIDLGLPLKSRGLIRRDGELLVKTFSHPAGQGAVFYWTGAPGRQQDPFSTYQLFLWR